MKRPCANNCGRLATESGTHCAQCCAKTPAGKARLGAVIGNTLRSIAPVLDEDENARVVATVHADATPELPGNTR